MWKDTHKLLAWCLQGTPSLKKENFEPCNTNNLYDFWKNPSAIVMRSVFASLYKQTGQNDQKKYDKINKH